MSEKTNHLILRKLSDERTDGRTDRQTDRQTDGQIDGQTDESDFIGRCPTNVERPIRGLVKKLTIYMLCFLKKVEI